MKSKLILGTAQLGLKYGINNLNGFMSAAEGTKILELAVQEGIQTLDTAADYGDSEKKIGAFNEGKSKFKIITKFSKKEGVNWKESLKQSLKNLRRERVDTIMFHSFESYLASKPILKDIIQEGKDRWFNSIGVSVYTNEELSQLYDEELIDIVQCPFNMLDNHFQRAEYLIKLKSCNKITHIRSVFLQGLFLMGLNKIPSKLSPLYKYCSTIHSFAMINNLSVGHIALQYVLSKNYVDGVLIGVDSSEQLKVNIEWSRTSISPIILSQIDEIIVNETALLNPSTW